MSDITQRLREHDDDRLYREADELMSEAADEIERLRGERKVLADLLHQAGDVLETIDSECLYEALELGALVRQIAAAVTAVRTGSHHQSTGTQNG